MKLNMGKFKELWGNKYAKSLLFFGFYLIFFAVVLTVFRPTETPGDNTEEKSIWDNINTNYEYLYEIEFSDNQTVTLEGKKYNNKDQFIKKVNDVIDSEVYMFYAEIYVKSNEEWAISDTFILTNDTFNNQYFDIKYIKLLIADSELIDSTTNFDGSKNEFYTFGNLNIEVVSEGSVLKKITVTDPLYKLTLQYKNINKVIDFVVEK